MERWRVVEIGRREGRCISGSCLRNVVRRIMVVSVRVMLSKCHRSGNPRNLYAISIATSDKFDRLSFDFSTSRTKTTHDGKLVIKVYLGIEDEIEI